MAMHATPINRIFDMPGHKHYGSCRRMWVMLEQLFADRGGVRAFEVALSTYREANRFSPRTNWDEHLANLIDDGQSPCAAQRIVMGQIMMSAEFLGLF